MSGKVDTDSEGLCEISSGGWVKTHRGRHEQVDLRVAECLLDVSAVKQVETGMVNSDAQLGPLLNLGVLQLNTLAAELALVTL